MRNVLFALAALMTVASLQAKTRKGDLFLAEGRARELRHDLDGALDRYESALSEDPADVAYRMSAEKARFAAAQFHLENGLKVRAQGRLDEALEELRRASAINPGLTAAAQEIERTSAMIRRDRELRRQGVAPTPAARALTPVQVSREESTHRIASLRPPPRLSGLNPQPINLKMVAQTPRILFETVCRLAGANLVVDSEYQEGKRQSVEFTNTTVEEALDYLAVMTRSYWKPLSANAVFLTNDNAAKRRDYEEQVTRVFYLSNVNTPLELQEIITTIRSVADLQRVFACNTQSAIVVRGETDRVALAEKIIADLDKPRAEVLVDVLVMEAGSVFSKKLTAAIASTGLNVPISFSPRSGTTVTTSSSSSDSSSSSSTTTSSTSTAISLGALGRLSSGDYSIVLPGGQLQAVLSDAQTKILQSPQLRSVDSQKATLKIGDRQPTATGSYQSGVSGVSVSSLVNTQYTYIDVGVNVDLTPKVHDNGDVSMHVELEISNVNGYVSLGGVDEPIIGQRKVIHDVRMRDGEVNLLGGLTNQQESKTRTGVPGLSSVPIVGRLFRGDSLDRNRGELLIALIPHIIRRPEITPQNLETIAVGTSAVLKLNYVRKSPGVSPTAGTAPSNR